MRTISGNSSPPSVASSEVPSGEMGKDAEDGSAVVPVGGNCPHARGCPAHRERVIGCDAVWIRSVACTLRSVCWVYVFIRLSV